MKYNIVTLIVFVFMLPNLLAQSSDEDLAMMEAMFMASAESGEMDQVGQACIDHMNNKSWQEISTNKKGEKQYYIVGVGTVSAPISSSAFADRLARSKKRSAIAPYSKSIINSSRSSPTIPSTKFSGM